MISNPENLICPVCKSRASLFDVVDFNKSCGGELGPCGIPIYYALCNSCDFCYSPEILSWSLEEFKNKIYNNEYTYVDPECVEIRPRNCAKALMALFANHQKVIKHLDYGGGQGLLSQLMRDNGFDSSSYDPFININTQISALGKFDLITAFEVFEHVADVHLLMKNLQALLKENGMIFFTTALSDGTILRNQRLTWWYASPRNGHISIFSKKSLLFVANKYGFKHNYFYIGLHIFWKEMPEWAAHLFK